MSEIKDNPILKKSNFLFLLCLKIAIVSSYFSDTTNNIPSKHAGIIEFDSTNIEHTDNK